MSTVPGESSWADAGLVPYDDEEPPEIDADTGRPGEHRPEQARPDLRDEASEPDVVEQLADVPDDESDDYPEA